jgi:hypothetical protein
VIATLAKEMGSAKVPVRKAACVAVGSALWELGESKAMPLNGVTETEDGVESASDNATRTSQWTPAATSFLTALTPALDTNLKTVSATPLNLPGGPLEGYVAAAIGFARGGKDGIGTSLVFCQSSVIEMSLVRIASKNPVLTGIAGTAAKPSFLLWDKVWSKVNDSVEEVWLVRAAVASLEWFEAGNAKKSEGLK